MEIEIPKQFTKNSTIKKIFQTCQYISSLPQIKGIKSPIKNKEDYQSNQSIKDRIFRKRTLDQVLKEGYFPTCSDVGLIFRGLMIAQGIASSHIEAFHEEYLFDKAFHGHVFAKIFTKKDVYIKLVQPLGNGIQNYKNYQMIWVWIFFPHPLI